MEQIKNYFKSWSAIRIIRIVLAGSLGMAYYYNHEILFLAAGIVLSVQAIFNLSCPGGSCSRDNAAAKKPEIKIKKYEPQK
ncbi:MAG: hypothetical protein Q8904_05935 [Bacteroidota bacterium]|nr:hypothetical protein [Bacteroidota bacterium]